MKIAAANRNKWKKLRSGLCGLLLCALLLGACSGREAGGDTANTGASGGGREAAAGMTADVSAGNYETVIPVGAYDSADRAVVVKQDQEQGTITLLNREVNKTYTLTTRMALSVRDAYGEAISLLELRPGEIVDVTFLKSKKRLNTLRVSHEAWELQKIGSYTLDWEGASLQAGDKVYELEKSLLVLTGGNSPERLLPSDILPTDIISIRGVGARVYSIVVEGGQGYLRLKGYEKFLGGWIEVGQEQIRRITEDMLLTLPEGSYPVIISHKGGGGTREVRIQRNEETLLDISDMEIPSPAKGKVSFTLSPSSARLFIDGEEVNAAKALELEYGIYQIEAKAEGYNTSASYLRVGQPSAKLEIVLEKTDQEEPSRESTQQEESGQESTQQEESGQESTQQEESGRESTQQEQ